MLLDTSVLIDFLRKNKKATVFLEKSLASKKAPVISVITQAELFSGQECNDKEKRKRLQGLLAFFQVIPVDWVIAKKAGFFRRQFGVSLLDALIAATAVVNGYVVVTKNLRDFKRMKGVQIVEPY